MSNNVYHTRVIGSFRSPAVRADGNGTRVLSRFHGHVYYRRPRFLFDIPIYFYFYCFFFFFYCCFKDRLNKIIFCTHIAQVPTATRYFPHLVTHIISLLLPCTCKLHTARTYDNNDSDISPSYTLGVILKWQFASSPSSVRQYYCRKKI